MNAPRSSSLGTNVPNDLVTEVLSFLPVKSLMRMRCLNHFCNSLFTDPIFIKMHLFRSARNPHLTLVTNSNTHIVVPFPIHNLLNNNNSLISLPEDDVFYQPDDNLTRNVVGSCNGLICLISYSIKINYYHRLLVRDLYLRFWNPSTGTISEKTGYVRLFINNHVQRGSYKFSFGYDNLTNTYKVVSLNFYGKIIEANVFTLGDNVWRKIQNFPVIPFQMLTYHQMHDGVCLSGTVNWLAVFDIEPTPLFFSIDKVDKYVIITLDLRTETCTQMRLPRCFHELSHVFPFSSTICVLMGCLSFSYDFNRTHFVIWRMMEFGIEESWTLFLKVSYENLRIDYNFGISTFDLVPLHLSEDGDTLILTSSLEDQAIIYNRRHNIVQRTRFTQKICWSEVKNYVESLVSTC